MRILGLEIKPAAPRVVVVGTDFEARSIISAMHDLPARLERRPAPKGDYLEEREVQADPLGDWYSVLPDKLEPKQVSAILRGALAGNLWQQTQLIQKMRDSWPMFAKCLYELRSAASMVRYKVTPFSLPGQLPTPSAKAKADFVSRCINSFVPDRHAEEEGFSGMMFDVMDAIANGISIIELLWTPIVPSPLGEGMERRIRAAAWVHPRKYACNPDGRIGVASDNRNDPMLFRTASSIEIDNVPDKYLVAKFKSKSGSPFGAGIMRSLAWYWVQIVYGRDFLNTFAQKYGNPFADIAYQPGIPQSEVDKFATVARRASAQNWAVHPNTGEMKVFPPASMSGDNPIRVMIEMADHACQILLLGQTLTTSTPEHGGGTKAQGVVHQNVKQERLEGICSWAAESVLSDQLSISLVRRNWGDDGLDEKPTVNADFSHVETPKEAAERMAILAKRDMPPLLASQYYDSIGMTQPKPKDTVVAGGLIGVQGVPMTDEERFQQMADRAEAIGGNDNEGDEKGGKVKASLQNVLASASGADLLELDNLVTAVEQSGNLNGTWGKVKSKLASLSGGRVKF